MNTSDTYSIDLFQEITELPFMKCLAQCPHWCSVIGLLLQLLFVFLLVLESDVLKKSVDMGLMKVRLNS